MPCLWGKLYWSEADEGPKWYECEKCDFSCDSDYRQDTEDMFPVLHSLTKNNDPEVCSLPDDWFCDCTESEIRRVDVNHPHVSGITESGWFCMGCLTEFVKANAKA